MSHQTQPVDQEAEVPQHRVAVIGAGIGGLGMAIALRREGITDFVILERAGDIGGTWRDNTYPGISSDIPAHAYQFSFELEHGWKRVFATGKEIKAYIDGCADKYGVRQHVRLNAEVVARDWDAEAALWRLTLAGGEVVTARFVVSALGPFADPKPIGIPGVEEFTGQRLHSSSWDHSVDLTGKRVAVVGTGASAVQLIPKIAGKVAHLDVFQRTPIWVGPKPNAPIPAPARWLLGKIPGLHPVVRKFTVGLTETLLVFMTVHYRVMSWLPRLGAFLARGWYAAQIRDPETRKALFPDYTIACKRPSVSNDYLRTFNRDNVDLVTTPIERITPGGVKTTDGEVRPVDVLVLATGFRMAYDPENFRRTPVRGVDGIELADVFAGAPLRAYEGISLPDFPNQFMIFGPYGWIGGTWHQLVETASEHVIRVIRAAEQRGATTVQVREDAVTRWTAAMKQRVAGSLWARGSCATANSYYYDHHGEPTFLRPQSSTRALYATRHFPLDDYAFTAAKTPSLERVS